MKSRHRILVTLLVTAALAAPVAASPGGPQPAAPRAAQGAPGATPAAAPTPPPRGSDYVEVEGLKSGLFDVRHRDPASLVPVLMPLGSGVKGAIVMASRDFNAISVRDFPENIATIEAAIKRLDVPQPPRAALDLRLHVLLASPTPTAGPQELPVEIRPAVTQLQSAFNFKGIRMLTPIVQRVMEGRETTYGSGRVADPFRTVGPGGGQDPVISYQYHIGSIARSTDDAGRVRYVLEKFDFQMGASAGTTIRSDISLREGEHVVVGTAALGGHALVLVLSLNPIK